MKKTYQKIYVTVNNGTMLEWFEDKDAAIGRMATMTASFGDKCSMNLSLMAYFLVPAADKDGNEKDVYNTETN